MAFQLSPGVNVTEKDLTTIVPAVATTNAGIVGLFNWGPCNKRILVDSENNLVKLFGSPDDNVADWWFPAANFLGYGNNLQVVRAKIKTSGVGLTTGSGGGMVNANGFGFTGSFANDWDDAVLENDDKFDAGIASVTTLGSFVARYPGALGSSLEVQICGSRSVSSGLTTSASGLTAYGSSFSDWTYASQFDATPNTTQYVTDLGGANDEFHLIVIDRKGLFTGSRGEIIEKFSGLSFLPGVLGSDGSSNYYVDQINRTSRYIASLEKTNSTSFIDLLKGSTGAWGAEAFKYYTSASLSGSSSITTTNGSFGVGVWQLAGGSDGFASDLTNYKKVAFGQDADEDPEGYRLFEDAETVDVNLLLGGPEPTFTPDTVLTTSVANLVAPMIKDIVDARKDCVAFFSTPNKDPNETDQKKQDRCIQYRNNIGSSSYCVIDSGYKYQYDVYNDKNRWVAMNGDIAGLCARTDTNFDPWYSPAGFNRGNVRGVIKLAFQPRQASRDVLYKNNINPVVTFSGEGTVLYGDKTAQAKPSAFDRINVRRLFIVLEKAIAVASKYSLFEFNDGFTRAQFRSLVEPFLRDVQARRGIIDFKVVCDEKNNTPEVIDSNRFVADIYIKPNRSINFIQLNFIATKTGVNFSEVGA